MKMKIRIDKCVGVCANCIDRFISVFSSFKFVANNEEKQNKTEYAAIYFFVFNLQ